MAKLKYEIIEVNNVEVTVDLSMLIKTDDMFFNATEIAKQFDKRPADFWKKEQNTDYLNSLINLYGGNKESYIKTRTGRKYGGTWMHQKIALQFARWLSSDFSVKLDFWIIERLREEVERKRHRLASKTGYLELSEAVKNDHEDVKGYHYSNEANLINRIVLGMTSKEYKAIHEVENIRDSLDLFRTIAIDKMQKLNTSMIELGESYKDRQEKLNRFYNDSYLKIC